MKLSSTAVRFLFAGLLAAPLLAQTQIGGGICNSSSLNGTYALSLSGRQVNSSGAFLSVLQANGSATFDGLSTVTIAISEEYKHSRRRYRSLGQEPTACKPIARQ